MEVGVDIIVETHIEIDFKTEADSEANLQMLKEERGENLTESQSEADADAEKTQNQEIISDINQSFTSTPHLQDDLQFHNNISQLELEIKSETLLENQHVLSAEILPELKTDIVETVSENIEVASSLIVNTFTESELTEIEVEVEEPESILPLSPPPPSQSPPPSPEPEPEPEVIDIGSSSDEERGQQQQQLTSKIPSVVSKSETFICDICSKFFAGRRNLIRHKKVVHILKPFSCHVQDCSLTFASKSRLEGHLSSYRHKKSATTSNGAASARMTAGGRLYWCIKCLGSFPSKESLDAHKLQMHWKVKSGMIMKAPEKPHVCVTCNKIFTSRKSLNTHVWGVHVKKTGEQTSPKKISKPPISFSVVFECRAVDCPATFPSPMELELHEKKHETCKGFEWKCSQCTLVCPSKFSLNEHYLTHTSIGCAAKKPDNVKIVTYVKENLISPLPVKGKGKGEVIHIDLDLDINEQDICSDNDNSDNIKIDNPEPPDDEKEDPLGFLDMDLDCHEQEVVEEQKQELLYSLNIPQEQHQCQVFDQEQEEIIIDEKPNNVLISESESDTTSFLLSDSVKVIGLSSVNNESNSLPISFLLPSSKSYPNAPAPM